MRKRVFSIFLAILVFFSMPVNVYATGTDHGGGGNSNHHLTDEEKALAKLDFIDEFERYFQYVLAQVGALNSSDFKKIYTNFTDSLDIALDKYLDQEVSVDDDGEVILSSDLVASIKQALKEYQEESCGFMIVPTYSVYSLMNTAMFSSGYDYRTFESLVKENTMVAYSYSYNYGTYFHYFYDMSPYLDGSAGFYYTNDTSHDGCFESLFYDFMSWTYHKLNGYSFQSGLLTEVCTSFDALSAIDGVSVSQNSQLFHGFFRFSMNGLFSNSIFQEGRTFLFTAGGSDVLIFNSLDALKNYSIDHRTVFTTEKFYEDTGDLTLSVDRMNETLEDMNGLLDQFRDSLPSDENLTEDQLEKLLGAFLDEFFARYEQSGGGGSGSGGTDAGGGSGSGGTDVSGILGFLESILQALEEGFTGILMYLDEGFGTLSEQLADISAGVGGIDESLEGMTQEQAGEMTDSFLSTVTSAFGEIGALLKTKFPFSLPWDLQGFLSVLGGGTVEVQASDGSIMMVNAYADGPPASAQEMSDSGAPVFRLPLVVASAGIHEELVVDLSPFEYVHVISRGMLTVLYCLALMNLTFKVVELGKGLVIKDD